MFTTIHSAAVLGLECTTIDVEVDIAGAWPGYHIVGLPDTAIQEAKERIRTAWKNSGLQKMRKILKCIKRPIPASVRSVRYNCVHFTLKGKTNDQQYY